MKKIFLGGTCNNSTWRNELIPILEKYHIQYFNPIVDDWTEKCVEIENQEKDVYCDCHLYVITPKMTGVYSIAEVIESVHMPNKLTIFCYLEKDENLFFTKGQLKSLENVGKLVSKHNGIVCNSLTELQTILKNIKQISS